MRTLLLVCLAVQSFAQPTQTFSPPGKGTEKKRSPQNETRSPEGRPQSPSPPAATGARGINQPAPGEQTKQPDKETDQIWKKAFAPETWSSWALFCAAVAAAILALKTLSAIKEQARIARIGLSVTRVAANAARDGAIAARLSAQGLINSERPWLLVTIEQRKTAPHIYDVQARNAGRTPAELVDGHCLWKRRSTNFTPPDILNDPIIMPAQNLIVSGDSFPVRVINLNNPLEPPDEEGLGGDPQLPYIYGTLRYWDTVADRKAPGVEPYVTQWMLWYDQAALRFRGAGRYTKNT